MRLSLTQQPAGLSIEAARATGEVSLPKRHLSKVLTQALYSIKGLLVEIQESPIVILGNQKSGTSAIAHLLADLGDLSKTVDIPPLWSPVGVRIMQGELAFAEIVKRNRAYFSTKVIKEPMMTFFADQVRQQFPKGRYVFVVRDPRDNIRSLLNRKNIPGHLDEIGRGYIPREPPYSLMVDPSVWGGEGENYVGVLAHRWNRAVDTYLRWPARGQWNVTGSGPDVVAVGARSPRPIELARYEDFCRDKKGYILDLAARLGVEERRDISGLVDIQYQPAGDHRTSWEGFFGPRNLARITAICGERMSALGYRAETPRPSRPVGARSTRPSGT